MRSLASALIFCAACSENATVPSRDPYEASAPEPLACFPNLDFQIEAHEIQPAIGVPVRYLVSPEGAERAVDVAGAPGDDGASIWDWSIDLADDQQITVEPAAIADRWYAGEFPGEAFVTPFDAGGRVESIGVHQQGGLFLLGLASSEPDPPEGRTLLVYQSPVEVLRFPITPGMAVLSAASVENGILRGLPYAGTDTYEIAADAVGELRLPQLGFTQVHRVRSRVTIQPSVGAPQSRRQVSFYFECFAEVARAVSLPDEPQDDFTVAAELRRLGL